MIILALTDPGSGCGPRSRVVVSVASLSPNSRKQQAVFITVGIPWVLGLILIQINISTCSKEHCFDCLIDLTNKHVSHVLAI